MPLSLLNTVINMCATLFPFFGCSNNQRAVFRPSQYKLYILGTARETFYLYASAPWMTISGSVSRSNWHLRFYKAEWFTDNARPSQTNRDSGSPLGLTVRELRCPLQRLLQPLSYTYQEVKM